MRGSLIFALVIAALAVVFALANSQPVEVNLFFGSPQAPLVIILLVTFAIGALAGILAVYSNRLNKQRKKKKAAGSAPGATTGGPTSASGSSATADRAARGESATGSPSSRRSS